MPEEWTLERYHQHQRRGKGKKRQNSRQVPLDGYVFDSETEARRYQELKLLARAGHIRDLKPHPEFSMQKSGQDKFGRTYRKRSYKADFKYWDIQKGRWVAEEVKARRITDAGNVVPVTMDGFTLRWDMVRKANPDTEFILVY